METITNKQANAQLSQQPTPAPQQHPTRPPYTDHNNHDEKQQMLAQMQHKCNQAQFLLYKSLLDIIR